MAIRQMLRRSLSSEKRSAEVPKGHFAVYVGHNEKKRFVIPVSYLNHPSFQELLYEAEEEFGFHHPMGGLTIPCTHELFIGLISDLNFEQNMKKNYNNLEEDSFLYDKHLS